MFCTTDPLPIQNSKTKEFLDKIIEHWLKFLSSCDSWNMKRISLFSLTTEINITYKHMHFMFCWPCISIHPCNENRLGALSSISLFRQSTSTCFGHICSPSSGGIVFIFLFFIFLSIFINELNIFYCNSTQWLQCFLFIVYSFHCRHLAVCHIQQCTNATILL